MYREDLSPHEPDEERNSPSPDGASSLTFDEDEDPIFTDEYLVYARSLGESVREQRRRELN